MAIAGLASVLAILLSVVMFLQAQVQSTALAHGLGLILLFFGVGIGFVVPFAYADSIVGVRVTRHGIGLRLASRREVVVRWGDVDRLEISPADSLLVIETCDTPRRAACLPEMDRREIAAWVAANRLCRLEVLDLPTGVGARSPAPGPESADII